MLLLPPSVSVLLLEPAFLVLEAEGLVLLLSLMLLKHQASGCRSGWSSLEFP